MPGLTVTLTTHGTVYNLYTLIKAAFPNAEGACRELHLSYDPGNSAQKIYVGGNDVATDNFGQQITATLPAIYRSDRNNIPMAEMGLISDGDAAKVDVAWMYA